MPISGRRPFSEMGEVLQNELIREAATGETAKYFGLVNQVHVNELPSFLPERYIRKDAFILTAADYTTGTVTVGTGTSNIIGASTSWTSASSTNFNIHVDGYDQTYRVTFDAGTSLNFQNSLGWTEASGSGLTYTLFQDRYQLATDFGYMVKDDPANPNVVYRYQNGVKLFLTPWTNEEYDRNFTANITTLHAYTVKWVSELPYLFVQGNPDIAENVGYTYVPRIAQMRELTTGTATISGASGTSLVLTTNASMTVSLDTSRTLYVRNDADGTGSASVWAKISTVTDATTATLDSTQSTALTSGTGLTYTISEVSQWPERFDDIIMYKAAWIVDPDTVQSNKWAALVNEAIGSELATETKRTRISKLRGFPGVRT